MNEPLDSYLRWRAAEESRREDDADGAFRTVFQTVVPGQPVSPGFTGHTMAAIAAAAERDVRRARRTRAAVVAGGMIGGSAAAYFGTGWAISLLSSVFIGALNLLIAATVSGAAGLDAGADFWAVLASLGRAAAALAADPKVTIAIVAIQGIAIAALFALQRLLGSEVEAFE